MTSNVMSSDNWKLNCTLGTGGFGIVELWEYVQNGKKLGKLQYNYKYKHFSNYSYIILQEIL